MAMYSAQIVFDYSVIYVNPWVSSATNEEDLENEALEQLFDSYYPELTKKQEEELASLVQSIEVELQSD